MAATEASARAARALDDLYRRYVGEIYRYAFGVLGNRADAEDVTQTTFVNALRALERGEHPRKPGSWLLVIAHNVIRQRWRQELARPVEVELDDELAGPEVGESGQPPLDEVVRALQRIPPTQREALVMRELEGRSYAEIAEILGLTTSALETLLFRARRSLAEELENLVTCDRAELAVSRQLDERLSRKERRRLDAHLGECPACSRFAAGWRRHRSAFRGLAVLPIPVSLAFWKGAPTAAAAVAVPTIGLGAGATGGGAAAAGAGGLMLGGGLAVKAAAVVAAVGVAGGVSYEGVKHSRADGSDEPARTSTSVPRATSTSVPRASSVARARAAAASALSSPRVIPGKALGAGAERKAKPKAKPARPKPNVGQRVEPGSRRADVATTRAAERATRSSTPKATGSGPPAAKEKSHGNAARPDAVTQLTPAEKHVKASHQDSTPAAATSSGGPPDTAGKPEK